MKKQTRPDMASDGRRIEIEFPPASRAVRFPVNRAERAPRKPGWAIRFARRESAWFPTGEEVQCQIWGG